MKSKLELFGIANSLHNSCPSSYYEFASNYILHMKVCGISDTKDFFDAIKLIGANTSSTSIIYALGISGVGKQTEIKEWCKSISDNGDLSSLTLDELHYVIGCANRKSKVSKISSSNHQAKENNCPTKESKKPKFNKHNRGTRLPAANEIPLKCTNCKKTFIVEASKPFSRKRDATCTECNVTKRYKY